MANNEEVDHNTPRTPPARTIQARERQLANLAIDLAEKQLRDGTASSQVVTHYLKLATTRERLEQEKLEKEVKLLDARTAAIEAEKNWGEAATLAIQAFTEYSPSEVTDEEF